MKKLSVAIALGFMFLALTGCVPYPSPSVRWLASPMSGELKIDGYPAANVKIMRHYRSDWYAKDVDENTYTDAQGRFEFSGAWKFAVIQLLHEPVIYIKVTAEYGGQTINLFSVIKRDYERLGELDEYGGQNKSGIAKLSRKDNKVHLEADIRSNPKKEPNQ